MSEKEEEERERRRTGLEVLSAPVVLDEIVRVTGHELGEVVPGGEERDEVEQVGVVDLGGDVVVPGLDVVPVPSLPHRQSEDGGEGKGAGAPFGPDGRFEDDGTRAQ